MSHALRLVLKKLFFFRCGSLLLAMTALASCNINLSNYPKLQEAPSRGEVPPLTKEEAQRELALMQQDVSQKFQPHGE